MLDVDGDDVRALERLHPPGDHAERLGGALDDRDVVAVRLQQLRRGVAGPLETAGFRRLVEAGGAPQPDVPLEGGRGLLHGQRHQPDGAAVQVDDLLQVREIAAWGERRQPLSAGGRRLHHGPDLTPPCGTRQDLL